MYTLKPQKKPTQIMFQLPTNNLRLSQSERRVTKLTLLNARPRKAQPLGKVADKPSSSSQHTVAFPGPVTMADVGQSFQEYQLYVGTGIVLSFSDSLALVLLSRRANLGDTRIVPFSWLWIVGILPLLGLSRKDVML
jgi:hypothetical protein